MNVLQYFTLAIVFLISATVTRAQDAAQKTGQTPVHGTQSGPTLARIKTARTLACGVDFEEVEYSTKDAHGNHSIFDLDLCKAVAVAILGPAAKFTAVPYRAEEDALRGLSSGEVDVIATASPNFMNTAAAGIGFTRPVFYDYQGFLVNTALGIHSAKDLAGQKVCFIGGTEIENQLVGYMKREGIKWLPFSFQEEGEMEAAFITRNCAAVTADVSQLAYERIAFKGMAKFFDILPEVIAKDPLSMAYRSNDPQWAQVVNWTLAALIQAEESGITKANVATMKASDDPVIQRLLGSQRGYGQYLGLSDAWAARTIESVGNYGEIFDRDLGPASVMKLQRGANNLWTRGGLMDAAPIR